MHFLFGRSTTILVAKHQSPKLGQSEPPDVVRFQRYSPCLGHVLLGKASVLASVKHGASGPPCSVRSLRQARALVCETGPPSSWVSCRACAQPLSRFPSVPNIAKGLKDQCLAVQGQIVLHHPQSLFNRSRRPPLEGYIPFSNFLFLHFSPGYVERVCLFVLIHRQPDSIHLHLLLQRSY